MAIKIDRRLAISTFIVLAALVIVAKLFYIQIIDQSHQMAADNNVLRRIVQYPARGIIYDRNGEILVYNQAAYDLMVIPSLVEPFDTAELCRLVGYTKQEVEDVLLAAKRHSRFKESPFCKQISTEDFGPIQEKLYLFPGFYPQSRTLRKYPRPLAAHLLGYVGEASERVVQQDPYYRMGDYIGISGLEKTYEDRLRGRRGVQKFMVDVHNRIKGSYRDGKYDTVAIAGADLHLSLDAKLQELGERLMKGRKGGIVALDPKNGEILAMVSAPTYDPGLLVGRVRSTNFRALDTSSSKPLFNRPIMAVYPPGSTFKVVNALIGLQRGTAKEGTGYKCYGRYTVGRGVGCHHHPYANSLHAAIRMSCNTYFCHVFRGIIDAPNYPDIESSFTDWASSVRSFGFGQSLGVDLPSERNGIVPDVAFYNRYFRKGGWNSLTIISLAIGQGELSTTPLQMANLASVIANRGHYYTPHVVRESTSNDTLRTNYDRHDTEIDSSYFEPIIKGMYEAVNADFSLGPTGWRARVKGVDVCGKTGTAQNPHGEDHSVFIAFAPREDPKIAIAVYIENAGAGGRWAAPVAGLMIEQYLKGEVTNQVMYDWVTDPPAWALEPSKPSSSTRQSSSPSTTNSTTREAATGIESSTTPQSAEE